MPLRDQGKALKMVKLSEAFAEKLDSVKDAMEAIGSTEFAEKTDYEGLQHRVSQLLFVYALVMNLRSSLRSG